MQGSSIRRLEPLACRSWRSAIDKGGDMHIQIITFHLRGVSEPDYRALCDEVAPAFAEVPGLVSKVWLANSTTNTYGGVYTWASREAMETFAKSELFKARSEEHTSELQSRFDLVCRLLL